VEWNVELLSAADMKARLQEKQLGQTHREDLLRDAYYGIVNGWGYKQGECAFSGSKTCKLGCGCDASTGWAVGGHMETHVLKLLKMADEKKIVKPPSPPFPDARNTNITLGEDAGDVALRLEVPGMEHAERGSRGRGGADRGWLGVGCAARRVRRTGGQRAAVGGAHARG
jgi:hypothetical protein